MGSTQQKPWFDLLAFLALDDVDHSADNEHAQGGHEMHHAVTDGEASESTDSAGALLSEALALLGDVQEQASEKKVRAGRIAPLWPRRGSCALGESFVVLKTKGTGKPS